MNWANPTVVAALIAVGGAVASAIVSYLISRSQSARASRNLELELEQKFNDHLYRERLRCYPSLYEILSDLGKQLRQPSLTFSNFVETLRKIEAWDSKNAILTSGSTTHFLLNIRKVLRLYESRPQNEDPPFDDRNNVFQALLRLEQSLKYELGVYSANEYHNPDPSLFLGSIRSSGPDGLRQD
jgi:hypothetical protein